MLRKNRTWLAFLDYSLSAKVTEGYWFRDMVLYDYVCNMKARIFLLISISCVFLSCGAPSDIPKSDSVVTPDSIPQIVRIGKEANWAYKPDTMINEILLADVASPQKYMHENGSNGSVNGDRSEMYYFNNRETEYLTIMAVVLGTKSIPYGLRLEKNSDTLRNYKREHNYIMQSNFITSAGIYIGMSVEYVQNIYKSQTMLKWVKGDTTYLTYSPSEKDKAHYHRYIHTDYTASYKFVDDKCRVIEMIVDPKSFEK